MQTIQRPSEAQVELLWQAPGGPFPINSQLIVGEQECVVATLNDAVLGVIPPGNYWLHPQPFPFLAQAVAGANIAAELWFVSTSPTSGLQFGGSLGNIIDTATGVLCSPRMMGTYVLRVGDPARFVGALGQPEMTTQTIAQFVSAIVIDRAKEAFSSLGDVLAILRPDAQKTLAEGIRGAMGQQLELNGLALVQLDIVRVLVSDEDRQHLTAAAAAKARERVAAVHAAHAGIHCPACRTHHDGGKFCTACGHHL